MKNLFAWLQIVRFPNVFAIIADILTTVALTYNICECQPVLVTVFLIAGLGSISFYWAGMILNDAYDATEDATLRPMRPIPSGKIALSTAFQVGWTLWGLGIVLCGISACLARVVTGCFSTVLLLSAMLLATCIWLYNAKLKNTPVGPFLMGTCRGLNVLMLLSFRPLSELLMSPLLLYPLALTIFITGVTFYARCETEEVSEMGIKRPSVPMMLFSLLLLVGGIVLLIPFPTWMESWIPGSVTQLFIVQPWRWAILLGVLALWLMIRAFGAYFQGPLHVQGVVKLALFTVFLLDAGIVATVGGLSATSGILACFLLATIVGRWLYST